jgi:hypothetical protein
VNEHEPPCSRSCSPCFAKKKTFPCVKRKIHYVCSVTEQLECIQLIKVLSNSPKQRNSVWEEIPVNVLTQILVHCSLTDIYSLMLSCRVLYRRIHPEEYAISREYLRHRKGQYLQSSDCSPGDDLTFISELFPPQPPQYTASRLRDEFPEYSFGYLADLTRCWTTCIRLSYYLADYAVQLQLQHDPEAQPLWSSCNTEKEVVYSRAVSALQSRLLCPLYVCLVDSMPPFTQF